MQCPGELCACRGILAWAAASVAAQLDCRPGLACATCNSVSDQHTRRLEEIVPIVRNLGKRHVGYGVQDRHYDTGLAGTMKDMAAEVAGLACNQ